MMEWFPELYPEWYSGWYTLLLCLLVLYYHFVWSKRLLPPGPGNLPVIGHLPWIDPYTPYLSLMRLAEEYGPVYGLWMGSVYTVVVTDVKLIKSLFSQDSTTGRAPLFLTHGIMEGKGIICAEGELWKETRRFVHNCLRKLGGTKTGHKRCQMEKILKKHVKELITCITNNDGVSIDPLPHLRHSVGTVMNTIVFGKTWPKDNEKWIWLQQLQQEGTKLIGVAGTLNFMPTLRFYGLFKKTFKYLLQGKHATHKFYQKVIAEQAEKLQKSGHSDPDRIDNVLQAFLLEKWLNTNDYRIRKFYNNEQFYHLLADLFGAGLETTLTTLRWYLMFMAKNQTIQEKVREEVRAVAKDLSFELSDMAHLPLFEASIYEAQRIRSVVPTGIPHGTLATTDIGPYRVPKGTMIMPLQWAIHMDGKKWVDPETFNPSRFINDEGKVVKPENFIPFQIGKRMCIGDELARMMLFSFGASIVKNFSFVLEDPNVDFTGDCGITLTPVPHKIIFTKIQTNNV